MVFTAEKIRSLYKEWAPVYDDRFSPDEYLAPVQVFGVVSGFIDYKKPGLKVIDFGIGTGLLSQQFKNVNNAAHITGLDISKEMLEKCAEKSIADELYEVDIQREEIPLQPDAYDVAVSCGVFELIEEPKAVAEKAAKLIKAGGHAAFAVLNSILSSDITHPDGRMRAVMADAGFEDHHAVPIRRDEWRGRNRYTLHIARKPF